MLRNLRSRRRPRYGAQVCAIFAALLLLFSVSLLHSRLGSEPHQHPQLRISTDDVADANIHLDAAADDPEDRSGNGSDDRIDDSDVVQDDSDQSRVSDEDEILRGVESEDEESDQQSRVSGYYFDHVGGVIRRALDKRSIDQWEDYVSFDANLGSESRSKVVFGSDDVPVDENLRRKAGEVKGIEDALLLKIGSRVSPLREGWGAWFDAKSDFLRRDRMFRSHLELLNPLNNPILQDPDGAGATGLTRGDKLVKKGLMNEFKKVPFLVKKPLSISESTHESNLNLKPKSGSGEDVVEDVIKKGSINVNVQANEIESTEGEKSEMIRAERRTLHDKASNGSYSERNVDANGNLIKTAVPNSSLKNNSRKEMQEKNAGSVDSGQLGDLKSVKSDPRRKSEFSGQVFADGKRWGYFPGLHPRLSFSNFMDAFFRKGKCATRVFMVWNSPPWMFSVRHQRGLESLLFHHRDACVVLFSETIELNFFKGFVKDSLKLAVAMPNLDELLKDTPAHIFASVWFEWKKTRFYPTHYSELVRLVALYKYGGIYLDSDIIVLKPLSSLNNTVGREDQLSGSSINGAVMSFRKHSPFIMECLTEFYSTYDDTRLRWNGADLLTRVARNFLAKENISDDHQMELNLQPSFVFFPVSRNNITRYFTAPTTEAERAEQEDLFSKILNESITFHFWNSLTYALIPEPDSLVAKVIDRSCIRCSDVL